jgi:preprotein translocase subunit SecG
MRFQMRNFGTAHDEATQAGQPMQATFALDELRRRESRRSEATMRRLTWVIAVLTIVNVVAVVVALFK